MSDRLINVAQVAKLLAASAKTIRRWDSDAAPDRRFPRPVLLPSPSGERPMKRWRESEICHFAGLEQE